MHYDVDADGKLIVLDAATSTRLDISYRSDVKIVSDLPAATTVYVEGCTGLTTLDLPAATTVDARGCTGLTNSEWLNDFLVNMPELLTAGGKTVADVAEHWDCHSWDNCPMAAAFNVGSIGEIPEAWRTQAATFIALFDARLLPRPEASA